MEVPKGYMPPRREPGEALAHYRSELESMVQTDGWKVYQKWMETQLRQLIAKFENETDPNILLRNGGAYAQAKLILEWPDKQIAAFKMQEKMEQEKKQRLQPMEIDPEGFLKK